MGVTATIHFKIKVDNWFFAPSQPRSQDQEEEEEEFKPQYYRYCSDSFQD